MKTMMLDDRIMRVTDSRAEQLYSEGWEFVRKSLWKENVRDVKKEAPKPKTKNKSNKLSKSQKRHQRKKTVKK